MKVIPLRKDKKMKIKVMLASVSACLALGLWTSQAVSVPALDLKTSLAAIGAEALPPAQEENPSCCEFRVVKYGTQEEVHVLHVGEKYNIKIKNVRGEPLWFIIRGKSGPNKPLLLGESAKIIRPASSREGDWMEDQGQYFQLIDDPDGTYKKRRGKLPAGFTMTYLWQPKKAGRYRIEFRYSPDPKETGLIPDSSDDYRVVQ